MAIEVIPKEAKKLPLWQNILFYFSIALALSFILGYFVLAHFIEKAEISLQNLEETIEQAKTPQQIALENEVLNYKKKIDDLALLISNHKIGSNFFDFLEKITHPKVFFSEINLDIKNGSLNLEGQTESFEALGQQILIFKEEEKIKNFKLSETRIGKEGRIEFSLRISLDPRIFLSF